MSKPASSGRAARAAAPARKAASARKAAPAKMPVIWSVCHTGGWQEDYIHQCIDRAAAEGVSGLELSGHGVDSYLSFSGFPALAAGVDQAILARKQQMLRRICEHGKKAGLSLGIWHHEVDGPRGLLDKLPGLRAADGLIDLHSPLLYQFISGKIGEFFQLFPEMDELVLTMTETTYPVAHRPFCDIPVSQRIAKVLQAILAATAPLGKLLVIRPFSAVRSDELAVREAVAGLDRRQAQMMYKTEPFDWDPFLPDEELIGSVPHLLCRAETDAGAEYYGQGEFPASYTGLIESRLSAGRGRGAATAVIRIDRGAANPALGLPLNEVNVLAPTRALLHPKKSLRAHYQQWLKQQHGGASSELVDLLEQTFEVIKGTLYIDGQSITHNRFTDFEHAKHIQVFTLFEPEVSLAHTAAHWSMLPHKRTLSHAGILAEKEQALALARQINQRFSQLGGVLKAASRAELGGSLARLEILALASLQLCRLIQAHLQEMWGLSAATAGFAREAEAFRALARRVEAELGADFFTAMAPRMRSVVEGLEKERAIEVPLRQAMRREHEVLDYALCGFASEGHRLAKRLHSGKTYLLEGRCVRATGAGPDEGVTYHLVAKGGTVQPSPHQVRLTLARQDRPTPGVIASGGRAKAFEGAIGSGFFQTSLQVPDLCRGQEVAVTVYSTSPRPCILAMVELLM